MVAAWCGACPKISVTAAGDKRGSRGKAGAGGAVDTCAVKVVGDCSWARAGVAVGTALCNYRDLEGEKYRERRDV